MNYNKEEIFKLIIKWSIKMYMLYVEPWGRLGSLSN
jgi:hypothetical protein